ncbi:NAD(P)H-dependent flavin oxidoreductase [Fodinicurvata sediminis]|uniref:NAD(P)H-dependent flavin oxidoreductase n=1 Tax=Fodinicurvata sediminis TaxID=1121832 RepID=UPI0003B6B7C0|nr:nitronate monooxygenase [Fodinicurvata sediminis]
MAKRDTDIARAERFCSSLGLRKPILLAPMAGACPPQLSAAVADAGGLGACGALLMQPDAIQKWAANFRSRSNGGFQMNLWIPDPPPVRNSVHEAAICRFLSEWGPDVEPEAIEIAAPDFSEQCEAMLEAGPTVISSIMGLYPPEFVRRMKERGIRWFATVTTVAEAKAAEEAGADALVAQGMEAGGHRGAFQADSAETAMIGLFSLLPAVVDAVEVPVIATGGIADARGVAAALLLGASAVQIGTSFLRTPEAALPSGWSEGIGQANPEDTRLTRAFSGRAGRSLVNDYLRAAHAPDAPEPAPYPVQRSLTQAMRSQAAKSNDPSRMQSWAGQSARLAQACPAADIADALWNQAEEILS